MGMILRYGNSVTKKKKKEKKIIFVRFNDQRLSPNSKSIIAAKMIVRRLKIGLEMGMV